MNVRIIGDVAVSPNLTAKDSASVCVYPSTTLLNDGSIVCVYRRGTAKHSRDGVLVSQRSSDGGRSWSTPVSIYDAMSSRTPESVQTGAVCETPRGGLLAFFTAVEAIKPDVYIFSEEGRQLWQRPCVAVSPDGGRTWAPARQLELTAVPRNVYLGSRPLILPDGALLLPIEITDAHGQQMTLAAIAEDGGLNFGPAFPIAADASGSLGFGDGRFTTLEDGTLLMLTWTYRNPSEETIWAHLCRSIDGGRTWSAPQPTNLVCQIMTPQAMGSRLIAAANVRTPPEGIWLFGSGDGGKTWDTSAAVQLWDPRELRASGAVRSMLVPAPDRQGVWGALPSFTFGTPELVRLGANDALVTYYAIIDGITHVRACRFSIG